MNSIERHWGLILLLSVVVVVLVFFGNSRSGSTARAVIGMGDGAGGNIFAVPVQLSRETYGLAMFDIAAETVWMYEFSNRGPTQARLRLLAARSFHYDRLLTDYNTAPRPQEIKEMLDSLSRSQKLPQDPAEELEEQAQPEAISF